VLILGAGVAAQAGPEAGRPDPAQRRMAVLEIVRRKPADGLPRLAVAMQDDNAVVRRAAVRGLREWGAPARGALAAALSDSDGVVRLTAFQALDEQQALTVEQIAAACSDRENASLRHCAVQAAARFPASAETRALLEKAVKDESEAVRAIASKALYPFPFFRKVESIRDGADQVVNVSTSIPLPAAGWKLKLDPQPCGHAESERWFDPGLDEAGWADVEIGRFWDAFGLERRTGIGWYRGRFKLPARPLLSAVELCFEAVDESAWVWVNGEYAGQHDLGQAGWKTPFCLDVTPFLRWAAENHIAVRVLNTAEAGGIWKPVRLDVIKVGR